MSLLIFFFRYLEEALGAGVRGFAVHNCLLIPGFPPWTPSQGNSKKNNTDTKNTKVKYTVLARSMFILLGQTSQINSPKNKYYPNTLFYFGCWGGGDLAVQGGEPAVWGIFLLEARVCSFCWGEPARLTHQKTSTPERRSVLYLFFGKFIDLFFCCYLGEALRAGVKGFTVDHFLLMSGLPPWTPSQGNRKINKNMAQKWVKYFSAS